MPINSYALQYSNVNPSQIIDANLDLFITEGGPGTDFAASAIGPDDLQQIQDSGTRVMAYVNVAVADDSRPYWDAAWTTDGSAAGEVTDAAPAWLGGQPSNEFGRIVDFTDPDWQAIVIDQAVELVQSGFDGVFLDDFAQYFASGVTPLSIPQQATAMMQFAIDIDQAVRQVNPDAGLIVNGSPFVVTDAVGGANSQTSVQFLEALDGMLLENSFGINGVEQTAAIQQAQNFILPFTDVLALESGGSSAENFAFESEAREAGFVPFSALDASYSAFGNPPIDSDGDDASFDALLPAGFFDFLDGDLDDAFTVDADGLPIEAANDDQAALQTDDDLLL
jgi:uncharacterized protein (TIGR01370 family)